MAIKSISQLEKFQNNVAYNTNSPMGIGKDLAFLSSNLLTESDIECTKAKGLANDVEPTYNDSYYNSLFEISQPENTGLTTNETIYNSRKLTYIDLARNTIWDVKSYLNWRNQFNDYNLSLLVDGDQLFNGHKTFNGTISVSNGLTANDISSTNLSALYGTIASLMSFQLKSDNAAISSLTVENDIHFKENIASIDINNSEFFISGWTYGLKDNYQTKTTRGNVDNNKIGDPVCFVNGRPKEISCVKCAVSAYNLVNSDGTGWTCGTAGLCIEPYPSKYTVVKFVDGKPVECNEIDYAHHAYWSDLGEKYLADANYEPGTLVKFGGEKEITIADDEVNAIVSTKAFDLNSQLKDGTVIALCGRVPTKVKGKIKKFDKIMLSDIPGVACRWNGYSRVIGRALEENDNENIKLVECVTRFEI